jgi:branched-subunit amino acid ABC-type transport system permease component
MPERPRSHKRTGRQLPSHYWPMMVLALAIAGIVGVLLAGLLGVNPYIGALIGMSTLVLWETFSLRRNGF